MSTSRKRVLAALLSGLVFGVGLAVSGLVNPDNVLQFLTLSSDWSPALLFVMGTGVLVSFAGYKWVLHQGPVFEDELQLPGNTKLDRRLLTGAIMFGAGWGLAGFCPGPAIVGLTTGMIEPAIFVVAMIVGSQIQRAVASQ